MRGIQYISKHEKDFRAEAFYNYNAKAFKVHNLSCCRQLRKCIIAFVCKYFMEERSEEMTDMYSTAKYIIKEKISGKEIFLFNISVMDFSCCTRDASNSCSLDHFEVRG